MTAKRIFEEVLSDISLTKQALSALNKRAKEVITLLKGVGLKAQLGGSLAKGTMIKTGGKPDVDIFVVFRYSEDILDFEKKLTKIKSDLGGTLNKVHGSRDYYQISSPNEVVELIPVVGNTDPSRAENVTDVSLSHVRYVKQAITKKPELAKEILLAKMFTKAQRFYGAESYLRGFSGYSLEVLIIHYGSFVKMLKGLAKQRVLDPEKHYKGETDIRRSINESKISGPLILIDPTHEYRNVTAGLGEETFRKFLEVSKAFLKKPTKEYFVAKPFDVVPWQQEAKKKKITLLTLSLSTDRQEGDIAGSKMRKFFDHFASELVKHNQEIINKEFIYSGQGQEATGYYLLKEHLERTIKGPSKGLEVPVAHFRKARKDAYLKGKHWYAKEKTSIKQIYKKVKRIEKEMGVKTRLKNG